MRIIGLSGKAGSGKDTVAEMLAQIRNPKMTLILPFAYAIKAQAKKLGWNGEKDTNGRVLLQYMGARERKDDPEHWIRQTFETMDLYRRGSQRFEEELVFIITDVRFPNEAEAIHKAGGEVWRIKRPGAGLEGEAANHPSETEMDEFPNFDVILSNSGTLDDLRVLVEGTWEEHPSEFSQPLGQAYHQGKI
jgi:hypothetical protein